MATAKTKPRRLTPTPKASTPRTPPRPKAVTPALAPPGPPKPAAGTASAAAVDLLPLRPNPAARKDAIEKPLREKKQKLVRDSFTIPKAEYLVLNDLKLRAADLASLAKKSELLRAGIKALAAMPDTAFLAALQAVPAIKTGRPVKS